MTHAEFDVAQIKNEPGDYVSEALGVLKTRARSEGLIVDHDGTEAVRSLLGDAIEQARLEEGKEAFSQARQLEFAQTAIILAEKATDAARIDQTQFVGQRHIQSAIDMLRELKIWPFSSGRRLTETASA